MVSNNKFDLGNKYSFEIEFRLLSSNAGGDLLSSGMFPNTLAAVICRVSAVDRLHQTAGVRFSLFTSGVKDNVELKINYKIPLHVWYLLRIERNGDMFTMRIGYSEMVNVTRIVGPTTNNDFVSIGGNILSASHDSFLINTCVRNFKINDVVQKLKDYNVQGDPVSVCPPSFVFDNIVSIEHNQRLDCLDNCGETTFLTRYTADKPREQIRCCTTNTTNLEKKAYCDIENSHSNQNPVIAVQGDDNKFECIYDTTRIDRVEQVEKAIKNWGVNAMPLRDAFCQSRVVTCPDGMSEGCSRYFSVDATGDYCRASFNEKSDAEKNTAIFNYCSRHDTDDCKCANRSKDVSYENIKKGNPFPDSCWYIPCSNSSRYLIPSDYKQNTNCPQNICQIVFDISQARNVDIDNMKSDINCNFNGMSPPPVVTPTTIKWYYLGILSLSILLLLIYALK